jgi:TonB-dependent receptor
MMGIVRDREDRARLSAGLRGGCSTIALCGLVFAGPAWAQQASPNATATPAQDEEDRPGTSDQASSNETQSGDDIIVTGYRQSLETAQGLKRNSDVIVDSVTSEDIGALPDRSVTEALQRIPGVSINRFAAGVDPDHFSAEGSGVVVRGLTYVRSEFNGREAFSANNGRSLGFADVPSELLGGVDVFKSPTADRIEGGIAGVVNLRTRKPFDSNGLVIAGSIENNYGDFVNKSAPTVSFLASNRWDTPIGEIGLLGSFVYSQLKTRADRFQISSFRQRNLYSDGDVIQNGANTIEREVYFPRGAVMGSQEFNRERYGYSAALQWRSPDKTMEATFQFLRSDARQAWTERVVEIATDNVANNGDSRRVEGTELSFDEDGLFDSGFITGPTGWRADQNQQANGILARVPMLGLQSNNIRRDHYEKLVTDDYGANFRWDVTDNFSLNLDYQHVKSTSYIIDNGLWSSSYQNVFIDMNGSDLPVVQFLPPQVCSGPAANSQNPPGGEYDCGGFGDRAGASSVPGQQYSPGYFGAGHTSFTDPFNSFYRSAMDHIEDSDGNSDALRIDGEYSFGDGSFLKSVRAGYRYADRQQTARFSTYNWGRLSEQWGNNGPVWLDDPVDGVPGGAGGAPLMGYQPHSFPGFFRGAFPNPLVGDGRLFYSGNTALDYQGYSDYASAINREWEATVTGPDGVVRNGGWNPLANRLGVIAGTPFLPGEINPIRETNNAGYVMARFGREFSNGWNLSGNIGLRYSRTDRRSDGFVAFPTPSSPFPTEQSCADVPAGQDPPAFCLLPLETRNAARAYTNGAVTPTSVDIDYEYWLPSVNLKLEVGGGVQFRAAYFKGVAPPSTGLIRNFFNVNLATVQDVDANGDPIEGAIRLQGTFNAGNPYLLPTTADNFDLTAEWYFSRVGQLTASLFYKRLHGVLTNDIVRTSLTNNGATFDSVVTTPVNSPETGEIKGIEIAYQQTFDFLPGFLSGLGLQANYTYIDSQGVPQSTLSETDPDVGAGRVTTVDLASLPLQGLSKHAFNITPFIDIGPLSLRASYSWRSDFLLTIRDVIFPYDPIINKANGQLDASAFLSVTDNFKLGVQGVNLLNMVTKTAAVIEGIDGGNYEVPRGWYMNDRRFSVIARFNF